MNDNDGENLYHQADTPKTVYLEVYDGGWIIIAQDTLSSADNSDNTLTLTFEIEQGKAADLIVGVYDLRVRFDGDDRYNPSITTGTLTVLHEDAVLSDPENRLLIADYTLIDVTLFDNDNETLFHQEDTPKAVYLEYNSIVSGWTIMSQDTLNSSDNSNYTLVLYFDVTKLTLDEISGKYECRLRFDGDNRYHGDMSDVFNLTAYYEDRIRWAISATQALIDNTTNEKAKEDLYKAIEKMQKALDKGYLDYDYEMSFEWVKEAIQKLLEANKTWNGETDVNPTSIIKLLGIAVRDKTACTIRYAKGLVGPNNKHIIKALEKYYEAVEKLAGERYHYYGGYAQAIEKFKQAYREAWKARGEWVPKSYIAGLQNAINDVQYLINTANNSKAVKWLKKAKDKLIDALDKVNESDDENDDDWFCEDKLESSFEIVKHAIHYLEKAKKEGVNTSAIIDFLMQNINSTTYQYISEVESLLGVNDPMIDLAWKPYKKATDLLSQNDTNNVSYCYNYEYSRYDRIIELFKGAHWLAKHAKGRWLPKMYVNNQLFSSWYEFFEWYDLPDCCNNVYDWDDLYEFDWADLYELYEGFCVTTEKGVNLTFYATTNNRGTQTGSAPVYNDTFVYLWDFGDGNTSAEILGGVSASTMHAYQNNGTYFITLEVRVRGGDGYSNWGCVIVLVGNVSCDDGDDLSGGNDVDEGEEGEEDEEWDDSSEEDDWFDNNDAKEGDEGDGKGKMIVRITIGDEY
ncbi:MAG: PKD domain-containing protein [Candidatus Thermoplasmatota archaeon]